jgi:hypothetical protein
VVSKKKQKKNENLTANISEILGGKIREKERQKDYSKLQRGKTGIALFRIANRTKF